MEFRNMTPHAIVVRTAAGDRVFTPSGSVPRVAMTPATLPEVDGIEVVQTTYGPVEGMPSPEEGIGYIVSAMVADRLSGRSDIYCPDTGATAIRENGQIVAVTRLIKR